MNGFDAVSGPRLCLHSQVDFSSRTIYGGKCPKDVHPQSGGVRQTSLTLCLSTMTTSLNLFGRIWTRSHGKKNRADQEPKARVVEGNGPSSRASNTRGRTLSAKEDVMGLRSNVIRSQKRENILRTRHHQGWHARTKVGRSCAYGSTLSILYA